MNAEDAQKPKKGLYVGRRYLNIYLFFFVLGLQFFGYLFLEQGWSLTNWFFLGMGIFSSLLWGYFWIKNAGYNISGLDKAFGVFFKTFEGLLNLSSKLIAAILVLFIASFSIYFFINAVVAIPVQLLLLVIIFLLLNQ